MSSKEVILNDREELFIQLLVENGGKVKDAAEEAGYDHKYAYVVRKRLAKYIAEAAQQYLSIQSVKAAKKIIDIMDEEMPNAIQLQAAQAVLDRAGVIKKDMNEGQINVQKANIFILPEKRESEQVLVIDNNC